MSSDSESDRNNGLITPKKTPKSTFKAPSNDRPKPIFIDEPKSFSTKKERGSRPIQPPPKPQAKTCPPVSRVFNRKLELTSTQKVTFLNKNETRRYESVQGTPLPSSKVYDSAKKVSYFEQAFKIEAKIGSGCFGNVYRVKSKEDGKQYAVKIAREVYRGEGDRISKLEEVRKHQVLLPHSNCVHFYQSWEEKGRLYQQFELCEGNLMELSETQHDIPESTIWAYLVDLLLAVEHLHDHGLIHMDIKPENIFLGREGICKLGDFGLVIDLAKEDTNHYEGDPRYLATEVLESRNFSKAADIFSLGVTILELACDLDLPKYGTLWHKLRDEGPNPSLTSKLSHDLRRVIQLMMTKHQERRPTVKQLLALPSVKRAYEIRQRQLMVNHIISTFKNIFSPFVSILILIWSCVIISPAMKVINVYKDWKEGYGHSTPTNTNTYERQDPFSDFYDEAELFKSPDQRPVVSSTDPTANFYIGDLTTNTNHLSFSSDDEDIDCSPLSRRFERSSSSSQHSALARPITLNFSDDEEIESSVEVNYCTTPASQYRNYNGETISSKNTIELPDSSRSISVLKEMDSEDSPRSTGIESGSMVSSSNKIVSKKLLYD